ncbi:carbohydrate binding domain-containing protein [Paenibacillus sp. YN15]|uniref:carbohydrate binding domain-containing protein n=1 Tax=Paenibacillus sp. YN15 TaxID=1742774 RepID=UPI00215C199F|nr:carbohydrate binding domain-containing protein [Paenibacillus sp. YN15]
MKWRKTASLILSAAICFSLWQGPATGNAAQAASTTAGSAVQLALYVDPAAGSDANPGTEAAPFRTLEQAQAAVRQAKGQQMTGDILVYLRGGEYSLASPLQFTPADSGSGGYSVVYKAYPGEQPVISGGKQIDGWELHDAARNIYKASAGEHLNTRQLYVNGQRAIRARSEEGLPDAVHVAEGITTTMTELANWGNPGDLELVFKQAWTNPRGGVESITVDDGVATLTMEQPGWYYLNNKGTTNVTVPWYYENAYELLDQEREWYLDRSTDTFYYKPGPGEDMQSAEFTVPLTEQLAVFEGESQDNPVSHIRFEGVSFQYSTWLAPSTSQGLPDAQSNILRMKDPATGISAELLTPAAVEIRTGRNITFERCSFSRLGSAAVNITGASSDNLLRGNVFTDISGSGVQVGEVNTWQSDNYNPVDPGKVLRNNDVVNNYFNAMGADYRSSVAVFAAYPQDMDVSHNEIANMPYSGITIGWGWSTIQTASWNNRIENNYIHHVMLELVDGGAIYTLGASKDTVISGNYIREQLHNYGSIYLDEGSTNITARDNVMANVQIPVHVNTNANYLTVSRTYADNFKKVNAGLAQAVVEDILYYPDEAWPAEALAIIEQAGIEAPYRDIIPQIPDPVMPEEPPYVPEPTPLPVSFTDKAGLIQKISKAGTPRNNWGGWVGMQVTVGSEPLTVTALGRVRLGESQGVHRMRIVDAATKADILDDYPRLDMRQAAGNGDFRYVQLPAPVTLEAGKAYYILSEEKSGEDLWYDSNLRVTASAAATVDIGIWLSGTFKTGDVAGNSFAGVDFLYEKAGSTPAPVTLPQPQIPEPEPDPEPLPVDLDDTLPAITAVQPGTLRHDWSGWAGMKMTAGPNPVSVTALGRLAAPGNSETHKLRLVDAASGGILAEAEVDMAGSMPGAFVYAQLYEPVNLLPGRIYYLLSLEEKGGDAWHDGDTTAQAAPALAINGGVSYSNDRAPRVSTYLDNYLAGNMYAGVDFRYSSGETPVANLLNNGGFEYSAAGWTPFNSTVSRVTANTYNQSAGSAKVSVTANYGSATQLVALEKNKVYDVSVWVRLESGQDVAQIILDHGAGTPRYTYIAAGTAVDTTWRQLKGSFKYSGTNDAGNATVQLRIGGGTAKLTYYFDEFTIRESAQQILNGGFEQNTSGWAVNNAALTRVTDVTYGQSAGAAKVVMTNPYGAATQEVVLKKGVSYDISVWVKLASGTDVAQIILDHGSGTPRYSYLAVGTAVTDGEWRQLKTSFTYTGTNDTGKGKIQLRIGNGTVKTTYYFDQFSIVAPALEQLTLEAEEKWIAAGEALPFALTGVLGGAAADLSGLEVHFLNSQEGVVQAVYEGTVNGAVYGRFVGAGDGSARVSAKVVFNGQPAYSNKVVLQVDGTPPVSGLSLAGEETGGIYAPGVTMELAADDAGSGVRETLYSTDGGSSWTVYGQPVVLTEEGDYVIGYYSVDRTGNREAVRQAAFHIRSSGSEPGPNPNPDPDPNPNPNPGPNPNPNPDPDPDPNPGPNPNPNPNPDPNPDPNPRPNPNPNPDPEGNNPSDGDYPVVSTGAGSNFSLPQGVERLAEGVYRLPASRQSAPDPSGGSVEAVRVEKGILEQLAAGASGKEALRQLVIPLGVPADRLQAEVPAAALAALDGKLTLSFQGEGYSYELPLQALSLKRAAAAGGASAGEAVIRLELARLADLPLSPAAEEQLLRVQGKLVSPWLDYRLQVEAGDYRQEVADFGGVYTTRSLILNGAGGGLEPERLAAVALDDDGELLRFVPAQFRRQDGAVLAELSRAGNGRYAVVETGLPVFADLAGHWAEQDIRMLAARLLAARLLVDGVSAERFEPDGTLTRAQFAALLARGLSLLPAGQEEGASFRDVPAEAWFAQPVAQAVRAGLIEGGADGAFRPLEPVTRQEMAVMLQRAARYAGLPEGGSPTGTAAATDLGQGADWALPALQYALGQGFFAGDDAGRVRPQANAARAEAAVALKRLLQAANFISP